MEWYKKTQAEVEDFFLVKSSQGLDEKEALRRLASLGKNSDPELRPEVVNVLKAEVVRNGEKQKVSVQNLVNGDVVLIEKGNRVPADIRLIEVDKLCIDQSFFTNEGLPAQKNTLPLLQATELRKQRCMAFMGSFVTEGSGRGIVVARNNQTELFRDSSIFRQRIKRSLKKEITHLNDLKVAVNHSAKVGILASIDTVIFEISLSNEMILSLIRHLQMIHKIDTKFILEEKQAQHLSEILGGVVVALNDKTTAEDCQKAQFLVAKNNKPWLARLRIILTEKEKNLLLVGDGRETIFTHDKHVVTMMFGAGLSDQVICDADLISMKESPLILKRILYNKIKHKALDKIKK